MHIIRYLLLGIALVSASPYVAQTQDWFVASVGEGESETLALEHASSDESVYACGYLKGTVDGVYTDQAVIIDPVDVSYDGIGISDGFLQKVDSTGTLEWTLLLKGDGEERLTSLVQLPNGMLVVGGYFTDDFEIQNSSGQLLHSETAAHPGYKGMLMMRVSPEGQLTWIKTRETNQDIVLMDLERSDSDVYGFILSEGYAFQDGSFVLQENYQYHLTRFSSGGESSWIANIGDVFNTISIDRLEEIHPSIAVFEDKIALIAAYDSYDIYISDTTGDYIIWNLSSDMTEDGFVLLFDDTGSWEWLSPFCPGSSTVDGLGITMNCEQIAYTATMSSGFISPVYFADYGEVYTNQEDVFVASLKLDNGSTVWVNQFHGSGGVEQDLAHSVAFDENGNILVAGQMGSSFTAAEANTDGNEVAFISKMDAFGTLEWFNTYNGNAVDRFRVVESASSEKVFVGGFVSHGFEGANSITEDHNAFVMELGYEATGSLACCTGVATIACPISIPLYIGATGCDVTVGDLTDQVIVASECDYTLEQSLSPTATLFPGTYAIEFTVTGDAGFSNTCTTQVIVIDNTAPTGTCPTDQVINVGNGCSYTLPDFSLSHPAIDQCTATTYNQVPAAGTALDIGLHDIIFSASDGNGNTNVCSFQIAVVDNEHPTLDCPDTLSRSLDGDCQYTLEDLSSLITYDDNCGVTEFVQSPEAGEVLSAGTHLIYVKVLDAADNEAECLIELEVVDNALPQVLCTLPVSFSANNFCQFDLPDLSVYCSLNDACGIDSFQQSPSAGTLLGLGTHSVQLTVTDNNGNATVTVVNVNVVDDTAPIFTCSGDQQIPTSGACGRALPDYGELLPIAENCSPVTFVQSPPAGTLLGLGIHEVTLTASDDTGNSTECTFNVEIYDDVVPGLACPDDQIRYVGDNCFYTMVDFTSLATISDNCGDVTVVQTPAVGADISVGIHSVIIMVTDNAGNEDDCSFTLIVEDDFAPSITCSSEVTFDAGNDCMFEIPDFLSACTITENCGLISTSQFPAEGTDVGIGTTEITITATDFFGNTGEYTFEIEVVDASAPSLACPFNQTASVDGSCTAILPDYTSMVFATTDCTNLHFSQIPTAGTVLPIGSHEVEVFVVDDYGNGNSCVFHVTVQDDVQPSIICGENLTRQLASGCEYELENLMSTVDADDNCGVTEIIQSPSAGTMLPPGDHTLTFQALDAAGNSSQCSITLTVLDSIEPEISCSADIDFEVNASCSFEIPDYTSICSASDNCGVATFTQTPLAGTSVSLGTTSITLMATDASGNSTLHSFDIEVSDTSAPVISCLDDQTLELDVNCQATLPNYSGDITFTDECAGVSITQNPLPGMLLDPGVHNITLTALDAQGNTAECSFNVEVEDTMIPAIICAEDQSVSLGESCIYTLEDFTGELDVIDNCGDYSISQSPAVGTVLGIGTHTIEFVVTDNASNSAFCSMWLTVEDQIAPEVSLNTTLEFDASASCDFTLPDFIDLSEVTDNCGVQNIDQFPSAGTIVPTGTTEVTITATDHSGNETNYSFDILVADGNGPSLACPENQVLELNVACEATLPNYAVLATGNDDCSNTYFSQSPAPGTVVSEGLHEITIMAFDDSGNETTCTFGVQVVDNMAPTALCPGSLERATGASCAYTLEDLTGELTVYDNCEVASVQQSPTAGTSLSTGEHAIQFEVIDASGNMGTCELTLTVSDGFDPSISFNGETTFYSDDNCAFILPDLTGDTMATDDCGGVTVTQSPSSGTEFSSGTHTITFTAEDLAGNTSSIEVQLTVLDNVDPIIACLDDQVEAVGAGCVFELPDYRTFVEASDACTDITLQQSPSPGTMMSPGIYAINLVVADDAWNTDNCSFQLTVLDTSPPVLECMDDMVVAVNDACEYQMTDLLAEITASENCGIASLNQSPAEGELLEVGIHTVTINALDMNGQLSSCSFSIEVVDDQLPTISCTAASTFSSDGNCAFELPDLTSGCEANDNCGIGSLVQSPNAGSILSVGETTITFTATDDNGNVQLYEHVITVTDDTDPIVTCLNDLTRSASGSCVYTLEDFTDELQASDECGDVGVFQTPSPGTELGVGTHSIVCLVSDTSGNEVSCEFTVEVIDQEIPTIACPITESFMLDENCVFVVPDFTSEIEVSDNCGVNSVTQSPEVGTSLGLGAHMFTFTVIDSHGNENTCESTIVVEAPSPTLNCPVVSDQTVEDCQFEVPDFTDLVSYTAPCSENVTISQSPQPGSLVSDESIEITFYLTSDFGSLECSTTCDITYAPTVEVVCPQNQTLYLGSESCTVTLGMDEPQVLNTCETISITQLEGPINGAELSPGTYEVVFDLTGESEFTGSCTTEILVLDSIAPVFETVMPIFSCNTQVFFDDPSATDNCQIASVTRTDEVDLFSGDTFPEGITTLEYTAEDVHGNASAISLQIEVTENLELNFTQVGGSSCEGGASVDLSDLLNTQYNQLTWSTNAPNGLLDVSVLSPGVHTIEVEGVNGACSDIASIEWTIHSNPTIELASTAEVCGLETTIETVSNATSIQWMTSHQEILIVDDTSFSTEVVASAFGEYELTAAVFSMEGCGSSADVSVRFVEPIQDFNLGEDIFQDVAEEIIIDLELPAGTEIDWSWSSNTSELSVSADQIVISPLASGNYTLTVEAVNAPCASLSDEFMVQVNAFKLPTGFSPNGDGINEMFEVTGIQNFNSKKLKVFDAFGKLVYENDNYENDWGGLDLNGQLLPSETYYLVLELDNERFAQYLIIQSK